MTDLQSLRAAVEKSDGSYWFAPIGRREVLSLLDRLDAAERVIQVATKVLSSLHAGEYREMSKP